MVDSVSFRKSNAFNGALHHCGDNQVGNSSTDKDAEVIRIELARIPSNVRSHAISITAFRGLPFTAVRKALKITDFSDNYEILYLDLSAKENKTALFFALLYCGDDGKWKLIPTTKYFDTKTPEQSFGFTRSWMLQDNFIEKMHVYLAK
ncbi:TerD family protein [Histomonas meleagridis]|uniref:TerD family protein n=1 Tax=Histomonas meleagridis TaxID=135588 RepID=UPI00355A8CB3|nr:TerD family protein [Histomonas meleagridis]KAH0800862.1 TerD family protein [Histomonas meleagridis]